MGIRYSSPAPSPSPVASRTIELRSSDDLPFQLTEQEARLSGTIRKAGGAPATRRKAQPTGGAAAAAAAAAANPAPPQEAPARRRTKTVPRVR